MDKPLIPALHSALPGQYNILHDVSNGFQPQHPVLHTLIPIAGHPANLALNILGQCLSRETPDSPAYALVAYVAPSATERVAYTNRSAARFEVGQHIERWFAGVQLYFTEIDITDYADSLRLEYLAPIVSEAAPATERLVRPLHSITSEGLRKAA
ncbi:hypothetical protein GCM10023172_23020 [Hymenobacter ginsengisoli]|uniref:Uncharacterized protein n=1 Tax=Hymenobacter ginsengisoli TaxID=1051626 RepID=A0ABP8QER4_9BACT|nr:MULTISPECIES: hypothetical protein [unclassified Hymenobacter]MBO2031934.1 hypothetical protein [Hymenobacter sp. BT559]